VTGLEFWGERWESEYREMLDERKTRDYLGVACLVTVLHNYHIFCEWSIRCGLS
jgi:hypothetical protein